MRKVNNSIVHAVCCRFVLRVCLLRAETERGLSRKHIIEGRSTATLRRPDAVLSFYWQFLAEGLNIVHGCVFVCLCVSGLKGSLQRMQLEYVDVVFANRPDSNTPMEGESTRAQTHTKHTSKQTQRVRLSCWTLLWDWRRFLSSEPPNVQL